jgi:hypothetical protein
MVPRDPKICTAMRPLRPQAERLKETSPEAPFSNSTSALAMSWVSTVRRVPSAVARSG